MSQRYDEEGFALCGYSHTVSWESGPIRKTKTFFCPRRTRREFCKKHTRIMRRVRKDAAIMFKLLRKWPAPPMFPPKAYISQRPRADERQGK